MRLESLAIAIAEAIQPGLQVTVSFGAGLQKMIEHKLHFSGTALLFWIMAPKLAL